MNRGFLLQIMYRKGILGDCIFPLLLFIQTKANTVMCPSTLLLLLAFQFYFLSLFYFLFFWGFCSITFSLISLFLLLLVSSSPPSLSQLYHNCTLVYLVLSCVVCLALSNTLANYSSSQSSNYASTEGYRKAPTTIGLVLVLVIALEMLQKATEKELHMCTFFYFPYSTHQSQENVHQTQGFLRR